MKKIIDYLIDKYAPRAIIVYGSYADGTNGAFSDFDALIIVDAAPRAHDESVIDGVTLDVFLHTVDQLDGDFDCEPLAQLYHGSVVLDETGIGARVMARVKAYVDGLPRKSAEEKAQSLAWCEKMLARAARRDDEGMYRLHWLLIDSLEIYFDLRSLPYFGPKKALKALREDDPEAHEIYRAALEGLSEESLSKWIRRLRDVMANEENTPRESTRGATGITQ